MSGDRQTMADEIVESLLEQILSGTLGPDTALPPEAEIAATANASRLTAREAIKVLQAHNIVHVRRGVGTFVNPRTQWTSLDAILRGAARGLDALEVPLRLLEARRIVEIGAAELAATRRSPSDLESLERSIAEMEAHQDPGDVAAFTAADIAFHDGVLTAAANPFIPVLLNGLTPLLYSTRRATSEFAQIREHAVEHHRRILAAVRSGNGEKARLAMTDHLAQTFDDYEHYLGH